MKDPNKNPDANPWRYGQVAGCYGRKYDCPFESWPAQQSYLQGYLTGKTQMRELERAENGQH